MPGKRERGTEGPVLARFGAEVAVGDRAAEGAGNETAIEDVACTAARDDGRIAGVAREQRRVLQLMLAADPKEVREQPLDRWQSAQRRGQHLDVTLARTVSELQTRADIAP